MQYLVIPAYEPDEKLVRLVKEAYEATNLRIIVVDDGSKNKAAFNEIKNMAVILTHDINRGKGAALKTAFRYIREYGETGVIVTADADGQHSLLDICKAARMARKERGRLITGVRKFDNDVPLKSKLGNIITRRVFALASGLYVSDTQCGLRAFTADRLDFMLNIKGERYEYETNMLLEAVGIGIKELEIETIYIDNNSSSHFNVIRDSVLIYKDLLGFAISSLASSFIDYIAYAVLLVLYSSLPAVSGMLLANITARLISASFNYQMNKRVVFKDGDGKKSLEKYVILATGIAAVNNGLMLLFKSVGFENLFLLKPVVEIILFVISYPAQKRYVFGRKYEVMNENI